MANLVFTEGSNQRPTVLHKADQLLPNIVDGMAQSRPGALYALIPKSFTSYEPGYRRVTYADLANAINGAARLIIEQLGQGSNSEALAYVGPNDIGYVIFVLGAVKAGYHILSPSPRNTRMDHANLFNVTGCKTLLTISPPYAEVIQTISDGLGEGKPRIIHVPTVFALLDEKHEHVPFPRIYATAKDETLLIVHTSGTTGMPKPIRYTHAWAAACNAWSHVSPPEGYGDARALLKGRRQFTNFPFFHPGGFFVCLFHAIHNETTIVNPLAGVPPTVDSIIEAVRHVDIDAASLPAPSVEQIGKNVELMDFLCSKVDSISFGGGDISEACGNAFAARLDFGSGIGSTETDAFPTIRALDGSDDKDWKYIQPHPCTNIVFQSTPDPDLFEAVIIRQEDPGLLQPVFTIFPDLDEFRTRDLFSPHPHKLGLWIFRGRSDDMINSARGDMCNPLPFEQKVCLHQEVAAALMIGTGRYQKALLVEPVAEQWSISPAKKQEFVDRIWSTVETVNETYPYLYRIRRSHVLVTDSGLPLRRAGKGTVQRAPTLEIYRDRIDRLYALEGDGLDGNTDPYQLHIPMAKD